MIALLWILIIISILLIAHLLPNDVLNDITAPLNLFIFRAPEKHYSKQIVNYWVPKNFNSGNIPCILSKYLMNDQSESDIIIYSHGFHENLLHCKALIEEMTRVFQKACLSWDYSGFGLNSFNKWERTPNGINISLQSIIYHLNKTIKYAYQNMILFGYSLGCGTTIFTASRLCQSEQKPKAVILVNSFTSILDILREYTHEYVPKIFQERWNNKDIFHKITCPILLLHGENDQLIPSFHSEKLASLNEKATYKKLTNTGHVLSSWNECFSIIHEWLLSLS